MSIVLPTMRGVLSGFSPLSLSPALWLDAADPNTLYDATTGGNLVSAGGAIARWEDKSGNARHATQATSGSRPTRQTAVRNGRDVARFDGSNDHLLTTSISSFSAYSFFVCVKLSNWNPSSYNAIITHGYSAANQTLQGVGVYVSSGDFEDWKKYDYLAFGSGYPAANYPRAIGGPAQSGSDFRLMSAILGQSTARVFLNGATVSTRKEQAGTISTFNLPFYIGAYNLGEYLNGDIAEVIAFSSELSSTNRQRVERYLGSKWGITVA